MADESGRAIHEASTIPVPSPEGPPHPLAPLDGRNYWRQRATGAEARCRRLEEEVRDLRAQLQART
jgi:hypothetical protein